MQLTRVRQPPRKGSLRPANWQLKKFSALLGCRQRTAFQPSPNPIAPSRNQPVNKIPESARNPPQHCGHRRPRSRQLLQHRHHPVRTLQQTFHWPTRIAHHKNRVRSPWIRHQIHPMPAQNLSNLRRLRRHKPQPVFPIANQKPSNGSIAQSAVPVEDHQHPTADVIKITHTQPDASRLADDSITTHHRLLY